MPPVVLELGELEHIHNTQNLKLSSNAAISLSQVHPLCLSDSQTLENLMSVGTWVAKGNRLQICVRFKFDGIEISDCGNANIVEKIGVAMCNAEIWSQLGLNANLDLSSTDVEVGNAPKELAFLLSGRTEGRSTVRAPESVPSARLETVTFFFHFSTCRCDRTSSIMHEQSALLAKETADTKSLGLQDKNNTYAAQLCHGPQQQWFHVLDVPWCDQKQDLYHHSPPVSKHVTQKVNVEQLFKLLDASLRLMVCNRQASRYEGIILSKDNGLHRLVEISPTLFSPHFLEAMSQRNALLPNIDNSLSSIYHRTRSYSLRHKLEILSGSLSYGHSANENVYVDSQSHSAIVPDLQAHLWYLMQRELLDPQAWPRRKFEILTTQQARGKEPESYMLDSFSPDQDTETELGDANNDFLLESQDDSIENGFDSDYQILDVLGGLGARFSEGDCSMNGNSLAEGIAVGHSLSLPKTNELGCNSPEDGMLFEQNAALEDDDIDEDLFSYHRITERSDQQARVNPLDGFSNAERHTNHRSDAFIYDIARREQAGFCGEHCDQILDHKYQNRKDRSRYTKEASQCEPWKDDEEMLDDERKVLDPHFVQRAAPQEEYEEMMDAQQVVSDYDQALFNGCLCWTAEENVHEAMLDSIQADFTKNHTSSERLDLSSNENHIDWGPTDETDSTVHFRSTPALDADLSGDCRAFSRDEILDDRPTISGYNKVE